MITTAGALLRQSRRARRLTQRRLAALTGDSQSAIAEVETGRHDPSVDRLERLVRALGYRVTLLPTRSGTAADAADAVARWIHDGDEERAYRAVIQLNDDLATAEPAIRVAMTVMPPAATGDQRFDALIAGLVEYRLESERLPVPAWAHAADRQLDRPWVVDRFAGEDITAATPEAFRRHNVLIDAVELVSV